MSARSGKASQAGTRDSLKGHRDRTVGFPAIVRADPYQPCD